MLKRRAIAVTFAIVIVASLVAPALALSIAPAGADASGPSDMVALGNAQVSEDLPADADVPIRASDLEGNVWASENASTLEVIVTTPDRVGEYVETSGSNVLEGDDVAFVVRDDENHAGRDIAVGAQLLEDGLGYQPEAAFGLHSSGDEWSSEISYADGAAVFEVPKFSENTVSFSGGISLSGSNAVDGTSYSYDLGSLDGVDNYGINLTGRRLTEDEQRTATTDSGTLDVEAGGTSAPENAEVVLTGERSESSESASVSDGSSITVDGNTAPEGETITIEGSGSTSSESASVSDGSSISVDGTVDPSGEEITLDGSYSESTETISGSVSDQTTETIPSGGSLSSTDTQVSVTSMAGERTDRYDSQESGGEMKADSGDPVQSINFPTDGVDTIDSATINYNKWESGGDISFEVYLDGTYMGSASHGGGEGQVTSTFDEGSVDVDDSTELKFEWTGSGSANVEFSQYWESYIEVTDNPTSSVSLSGPSDSTTITSPSTESFAFDGGDDITISADGPADYEISYLERNGVEDVSATVDGETVSQSGALDGSVSESIDLSRGTHNVDVSYTGDGSMLDTSIDWTEDHRAHDPSVTVDGSTISHSGALGDGETESGSVDLSTGAHTVDVTSTGAIGGATVDWTEVTRSENPSVEIAGETVAHAGVLDVGQTTSQAIDLPLGSSTADISSSGPVGVEVAWTEVSETTDAGVRVNGNERRIDGTIPEGETQSLPADEAWLEEGTNNVEIVTADAGTGPAPEVGLEYQHEAGATSVEETVEASTWKESYNVSHTFPSSQTGAEARLGYADNVVEIRNLEMRTNGGAWESIPESDYTLENSTLVVDLGDVAADTSVDIRATGGKIRTYDGSINIVKPTAEGDSLATEIEVTDVLEDGTLGIDVSETAVENRVHFSSSESFEGTAHAELTASGNQILRVPDANPGSTMTIETMPVSVAPESGAIEVEVEEAGSEPRFAMRQGDTVGASSIEVGYYDTLSGERYVLWSETQDREVDSDRAESPVFFTTDGSTETYSILQRDAPQSGGGGGGAPAESSSGLALTLILPAVAISVGGLWWAGRRFGGARGIRGNSILLIGSSIVAVVAAELVTGRSLLSDLMFALSDSLASGAGAVILSVLVLVGLWQIDQRTSADVPWWITGIAGFGAFVMSAEAIRPGSVLGALEGALAEVGAAVILLGIIVIGAVLWRRASTPGTEVTIDSGDDD